MKTMTIEDARRIAERIYAGIEDQHGLPEGDHAAAVAAAVPEEDRVVAWLHDIVEDRYMTYEELIAEGISDTDLAALKLVTREPEDGTYMEYVRKIAAADGPEGVRARRVKDADREVNMSRPFHPDKADMRAPGGRYDRARKIIRRSMRERGETPPGGW
jgi:(p)ppGpp synthase/HD superfamily hydrolase